MTRHPGVELEHGEALSVLRTLTSDSIDSMVTDPPAGIAFMGAGWDGDKGGREQWSAWFAQIMAEALRVVKPGGHALVWALPRTAHWTACGLEDAGWEIRDRITHVFGSGFPKGQNISKAIDRRAGAERPPAGVNPYASRQTGQSTATMGDRSAHGSVLTSSATDEAKQWDGWNTALKPAAEDWWLVRKPPAGSTVANVLQYGTGALNIDGTRVGQEPQPEGGPPGRWPANFVLSHAGLFDGTDACVSGCVAGCPVREMDEQSGRRLSAGTPTRPAVAATSIGPGGYGGYAGNGMQGPLYSDTGGASRFFPVFRYQAKAPTSERLTVEGVTHPTVKPLALMRWLVRLITPVGGVVLDPFAGSGTTGEAALLEGFSALLIESEADYLPLIRERLTRGAA